MWNYVNFSCMFYVKSMGALCWFLVFGSQFWRGVFSHRPHKGFHIESHRFKSKKLCATM